MTTKMVKWVASDNQIINSGLSENRVAKFLQSVVGFAYDRLLYECHLKNTGLL